MQNFTEIRRKGEVRSSKDFLVIFVTFGFVSLRCILPSFCPYNTDNINSYDSYPCCKKTAVNRISAMVPRNITRRLISAISSIFNPQGLCRCECIGPLVILLSSSLKFRFISLLGYCYLLFESERSVKALLANCTHDFSSGGDWYFKISSRRMRCKEVSILCDCRWMLFLWEDPNNSFDISWSILVSCSCSLLSHKPSMYYKLQITFIFVVSLTWC